MDETFAAFQITEIAWKLARSQETRVPPCADIRVGVTRATLTCGQCNEMWRSQEGEAIGDFEVVGYTIRIQCPSCGAVGRVSLADVPPDD